MKMQTTSTRPGILVPKGMILCFALSRISRRSFTSPYRSNMSEMPDPARTGRKVYASEVSTWHVDPVPQHRVNIGSIQAILQAELGVTMSTHVIRRLEVSKVFYRKILMLSPSEVLDLVRDELAAEPVIASGTKLRPRKAAPPKPCHTKRPAKPRGATFPTLIALAPGLRRGRSRARTHHHRP